MIIKKKLKLFHFDKYAVNMTLFLENWSVNPLVFQDIIYTRIKN